MPAYHDQDASEQRYIKHLLLEDEEMSRNIYDVRCEIDDGTRFRADIEIDTTNGETVYAEIKPGKGKNLLCFIPAYPWRTICGAEKYAERDMEGRLDMCWEAGVLILFWRDKGELSSLEFYSLDDTIKEQLWKLPRQKAKDISATRKYHNRDKNRAEYQFCGCGNKNCYYLSDYVRVGKEILGEPFLYWDYAHGSYRRK